jgi:hypothetical protein
MTTPTTDASIQDEITELIVTYDEWRLLSEACPAPVLTSSPAPDRSRRSSALASLLVRGLAVQDLDGSLALHPLTGWVSTIAASATAVVDLARSGDGDPHVIQLMESPSGRLAASPGGLELVRITALGQDQDLAAQAAILCERVWSDETSVALYTRVWNLGEQSFLALVRDEEGWKRGVQGGAPMSLLDPRAALDAFLAATLDS